MTVIAKPIIFLATANDRADRARYLRNLAEEARQVQRALTAASMRGPTPKAATSSICS